MLVGGGALVTSTELVFSDWRCYLVERNQSVRILVNAALYLHTHLGLSKFNPTLELSLELLLLNALRWDLNFILIVEH